MGSEEKPIDTSRSVPPGPVPVEASHPLNSGEWIVLRGYGSAGWRTVGPWRESQEEARLDAEHGSMRGSPPAAPASEPAVRSLDWWIMEPDDMGRKPEVYRVISSAKRMEWAKHNTTARVPYLATVYDLDIARRITRLPALEAELAEAKADNASAVRAAAKDKVEATARVRSMREAAATRVREWFGRGCVDADTSDLINGLADAILALPLDTGTATVTSAEARKCERCGATDRPCCDDAAQGDAQADAIKVAVVAANNRAADAFREWVGGDRPWALLTSEQVEAWLRSGEDAPGAVGGNERSSARGGDASEGRRVMDCLSCGEEMPRGECPKSLRPCGHHCNHSWSHDMCHWCETVWHGDRDTDGPTKPETGGTA